MNKLIAECKMKSNGFNLRLKIDECRELFGCNKDKIECSNCPCLILSRAKRFE